MKLKRVWRGHLGELMQKHVALRYAVGRVSNADECTLFNFHLFLNRHYPKLKTVNRFAIVHYLNSRTRLSSWGRRNAVIAIRQFCKFLVSRGIETYVPERTLVPKLQYKPRYFPLEQKQIINLIREIRNAPYYKPIAGETYATMLGLLWCTAMRRKEIIQLNHSDVDLQNGTILIRMTKFRKSRMVPLKKSVVVALEKYCLFKRKHKIPNGPNDPFFVAKTGRRMPGHSLQTAFKRLVKRFGLKDENGRSPSLHDIRHNFATHAIKRFYSDPENFPPQSYMVTLATFLGHGDMRYSQYYVHPDFALLVTASERIEKQQRKAA